MSPERSDLDPTLTTLQAFIDDHRIELSRDETLVREQILKPICQMRAERLSRASCFNAIRASTKLVEENLCRTCSSHSIDFWLALIRKLPTVLTEWPRDWIPYATLAILKWSNWAEDTAAGAYWSGSTSAVVFSYAESDLLSCFRIAILAKFLAESNNICRWLGKGATLHHEGGGILTNQATTEVRLAIEEYERRRPEASLLADVGILVDNSPPATLQFLNAPLIALGVLKPPFNLAILRLTQESFPINYFPRPRSKKALLQVLRPYDEALEDLFSIGAEGISEVLHAVSGLIVRSFPASSDDNALIFDETLDNAEFAHSFSFMLSFCRKGFVRFPEQALRESLTAAISELNYNDVEHAKLTTDTFFKAFCLRQSDLGRIDVTTLEPMSVLYTSPGSQCYLDLLWIDDFLRWLVLRSKEWFSSQHGDRFTLALKRTLNERVPGAQILSSKSKHIGPRGDWCEVDLLLKKDDVLYAVECKSYAKSRAFWLGEPKATSLRAQRIDEAVHQARKAASIINAILRSGRSYLPQVEKVEWVVCTPSQEYLKPVDKYGYLSDRIPRVCTPEELATHLGWERPVS